jgi:hypothetical protein
MPGLSKFAKVSGVSGLSGRAAFARVGRAGSFFGFFGGFVTRGIWGESAAGKRELGTAVVVLCVLTSSA